MLSSAKAARRSDTWLVRSGALPVAVEPISGPFVAPGSFCSRLRRVVRSVGSFTLYGRDQDEKVLPRCLQREITAQLRL
jgi:hypothetical protein